MLFFLINKNWGQSDQSTTRLKFLQTTTLTTITSTSPVDAAKYRSFGAEYPKVLDLKSVVIETDGFTTASVQSASTPLKVYLDGVQSMQSELKGNDQEGIQLMLRTKYKLGKLHVDLNTANTIFDEDT